MSKLEKQAEERKTLRTRWMYILAGLLALITVVAAGVYYQYVVSTTKVAATLTETTAARAPSGHGTAEIGDNSSTIHSSRIFSGPNQYPPKRFAAYGILAFRSRASPYDRDRHLMICNVYLSTLPHASELHVSSAEQMVTVWPISSDSYADQLNTQAAWCTYPCDAEADLARKDICQIAINNYGLVIAQQSLKDAQIAGINTNGIGPFLLAWSPSTDKGKQDALVLVSDLTGITTYEQANEVFLAWSRDIERDPTLWSNGWEIEKLRAKIRYWTDNYGPKSLAVFGIRH